MSFKTLMLLATLGLAYHAWQNHRHSALPGGFSPGQFVPAAMPMGADPNTVLILAPLHCPSKAAQRADALSQSLARMGIPVVRSNSAALNVSSSSKEERANIERAAAVLNGEIPAVFVNGMGKSNPSVEEVAEVYRRSR